MNCPKCGAKLEYGRICDECGLKITDDIIREQQGDRNNRTQNTYEGNTSSSQRKTHHKKMPIWPIVLLSIIAVLVIALFIWLMVGFFSSGGLVVKDGKSDLSDSRDKYSQANNTVVNAGTSQNNNSSLTDDGDLLKAQLREKYGVTEPHEFVRGDNTGKWRVVTVASATATSQYAVDYAKAYMNNAEITDIHYIVNLSLKTTTKLQIILGKLEVVTTEYVDKEEHDAKIIGQGLKLSEEYYDMSTGKKVTTEPSSDAVAVDSNALITAVKKTIEGAVGEGEKIKSVKMNGKDLVVTVDLSAAKPRIGTLKDLAEIRIDSITDGILQLGDEYYKAWDTVTLDFGSQGKATFDKSMVKDQGLGRFFDYPEGILK